MMIPVTKPFIPPIEEYQEYIQQIWNRRWLTNHGPLVNDLELKLKDYLDISHLLYLNNGTVALQVAIKALPLEGEVITTPFSYVATTSSLVWEHSIPVFVDIESDHLCMDPAKIEAAITAKTKAILATHVFGNPCDIFEIQKIAKKHNLYVIYDGAHAFGTRYKNSSIFHFGDISTCSFHATKLFQTAEGGAVFCNDPVLLRKMALLRNFGHTSPVDFESIGINGKNSELHAAMGLCVLPYMQAILEQRKKQWHYYLEKLKHSTAIQFLKIRKDAGFNHAYFPVILESETHLLKVMDIMNSNQIFPRRYFYPSLNTLPYLQQKQFCPISESISPRILCLPLYHDLSYVEQDMVVRLLLRGVHH